MLAGLAIIYAGGVAWLSAVAGSGSVVAMGLAPFVLADLVKAGIGAALVTRIRPSSLSLFGAK